MGFRKAFLMNITVKPYGLDSFVCRPDTTWERECRDFFSPGFVKRLMYTPVAFARISKAGKYISGKFVPRYYDGLGFGILLYPGEILESGTPQSVASASILDHTSLLPFPLYLPEVFRTDGNLFTFSKDGVEIFRTTTGKKLMDEMEKGIADASTFVSMRIGDLVACELAAPQLLVTRDEKKAGISAYFCGNELFRLSVII